MLCASHKEELPVMDFQVSGLPAAAFQPLFALTDAELAERGIVSRIVDEYPGFPCRVSLQDAEPGERVLLLNYQHLAVASPYRSSHAIYVREKAVDASPAVNEVPEVLRRRLLSLRAFDTSGMMCHADVIEGKAAVPVIERMLSDPKVAYLHVHNAKPGCFAARIDRA
jgi:hypothetical protein